jgi:hypothetical protein
MDDVDNASEREITERERMITFRRAQVAPKPDLGCTECMQFSHEDAKEKCEYFTGCMADWQRVQAIRKIEGAK